MNKKFIIYSLVALLTGSTITALSITDSARANEQNQQVQAPRPSTTAPMRQEMSRSQEVDKPFIEMMIPHHRGATEMAQMALSRAKSPEVKKLAQSIIQDQNREIQQMQTWYKQWYGTEAPMTGMHGDMGQEMMMSMQQQEKMDREMMAALENAPDFEQEFLRQMTRHHQTATMMAGMVVNSAEHPEIRNLAQSIIRSQSAEIAQMEQLLAQARR